MNYQAYLKEKQNTDKDLGGSSLTRESFIRWHDFQGVTTGWGLTVDFHFVRTPSSEDTWGMNLICINKNDTCFIHNRRNLLSE